MAMTHLCWLCGDCHRLKRRSQIFTRHQLGPIFPKLRSHHKQEFKFLRTTRVLLHRQKYCVVVHFTFLVLHASLRCHDQQRAKLQWSMTHDACCCMIILVHWFGHVGCPGEDDNDCWGNKLLLKHSTGSTVGHSTVDSGREPDICY